jgi:transposase
MDSKTIANLAASLPDLIDGKIKYPSKSQQLAIALYKILQDGEWHTTASLALKEKKSKSYVSRILSTMRQPLGLKYKKSADAGWKLLDE